MDKSGACEHVQEESLILTVFRVLGSRGVKIKPRCDNNRDYV
jgi:hypothetical protein